MFHMQERQLLLSSLFKKPVHNAVRRFSCYTSICYEFQEIEKSTNLSGENAFLPVAEPAQQFSL